MARHFLHDIDLERKTAFCTVCGHTQLYLAQSRGGAKSRVVCIQRASEIQHVEKEKRKQLRQEKRLQPDWQPRHELTEVNPETLTAVCAICGLTDITKSHAKGRVRYTCAIKYRESMRLYKRSHYVPRLTNPHALTCIDEKAKTAICATCGSVEIEVWYGSKKINRRCINVKKELETKQNES
jgi:hypothetical protein